MNWSSFAGRHLHRIPVVEVHRPGFQAQPDLLQVVGAVNAMRAGLIMARIVRALCVRN
jgi:hypothetical protein